MIITLHGEGEQPAPKPKKRPDDIRLASVEQLLETAATVVQNAGAESQLLGAGLEERVPKFSDREVTTAGIIGRGGFCVVRDIDRIRIPGMSRSSSASTRSVSTVGDSSVEGVSGFGGILSLCFGRGESDNRSLSGKSLDGSHFDTTGPDGKVETKYKYTREYVAGHSKKTRRNGGRYVLKAVNKEVDKITYMKGNVDIAMEAKFLAVLDHPNIIDLVGVSKARPCTPGYFLVLEKMTETLSSKIKKWMDRDRLAKGITGIFTGGKRKEVELYHERIAAAYDIASGLFYLHSKNIVYRDLKPANIGFDCYGQLKLFDFGLAKELKETDLRQDGTYRNMTAMTGAIRYMAPEVGLGMAYNLSVDVYSWSMVMWFILALEPPFGHFTENMISNRVHNKGVRPAIFRRWNEVIGELLRAAWDPDFNNRPNFLEITLVLKQELMDCEIGSTVAGSAMDGTERGASQCEEAEEIQQLPAQYRRNSGKSNSGKSTN